MHIFGHQSAPAMSPGAVRAGLQSAGSADEKRRTWMSGHPIGVLMCVLTGHAVAWGPCDRCHRRAAG